MSTVFSKILAGELPCHKLLEDERHLAFLEIKPLNPGHTLVIPKREVDAFFDLEDDELSALMLFSKRVARAIKSAVPCKKVGVMVAGLEVRHAHVHLVPIIESVHELAFSRARTATAGELSAAAAAIRSRL